MSDSQNVVSTADLTRHVTGAVAELQAGHAMLNVGIEKLKTHETSENAHGLDNPDSPMRKNIENIAVNALDSGELDERIAAKVDDVVKDSIADAVPGVVAEKLPPLVESEFGKKDSALRQAVANQVETIISDKIESGQLNGGGGGNKPVTPDKPVDPEPDQPDTPENPDDPQPPAVGKAEILSPVHGATGLDIPFTVAISDFSVTNDGEDTAKAVQLQVAKDSKFENIVFDSGQIAPTGEIAVASGVSFNEVVYLRARHIGATLGEGPWSTFVGVTTRAVLIESDDFWDVMPDPTGECTITDFGAEPELTLSLNGGPMYEAPAIDGAEIWRGAGNVFIRLAQASGMAINPAVEYEVFVTGDETLRKVTADEGGFAAFSFTMADISAACKMLVAAVAIDADGNRSAIARRIFRAVPKSHQLCANSLEEGTDFPAPVIDCKSFWKRESRVTMTVAPGSDAIPARYEAFCEGFNNIVSVNADAEGKATLGITLPASVQGETKILVRVVPVAASGRHGAAASKVLNIVTSDITLMPEFVFPNENDPINKGNVVLRIRPFETLCGDVAEKQDGARYRILDESGAVVFDSGILTQAANFDRYAAYAPDMPDDPGLVYTLQARVRGASLGWSEWASRKVTISQVASPKFTSPANGASFIWGGGIPCETSELALPAGGFDTHITSDWKLCYDNLGLDVICEDMDSTDLTSHNIVPSDVRDGANCFIFCRHKAQTAGLSAWSVPVMVKTSSGSVNQAVIVTPDANAVISVNDAGVTATSAAFGTDGLNDAHVASDWKICSDINGNSALVQALDSPDLLAHTFAVADCASLANGTVYYLFTRHQGRRLGWGPWSEPVAFTAKKAEVNAAAITSPASGAPIVFNDTGITLKTGAFSVDGAADIHAATDWKITSDVAGNAIALQAMASADKLSHLFTTAQCAALADGATLYAFARHKGARFGYGPWSAPVAFTAKKAGVNAAAITSPASGAPIVFNDAGITLKTGAFSVDGAVDTHAATDWKITSDVAGANVVLQAMASADKLSHLFTAAQCAALADGATLYAFARHKGQRFGYGPWSAPVSLKMKKGVVSTPSVISPTSGNVIAINTLEVASSGFACTNSADSHSSTNWYLAEDAAGTQIVKQDLNSADKTRHTFTGLSLTHGKTYYVICEHNGARWGKSARSSAVAITILLAKITASGHKIWKNATNDAVCFEYNDGSGVKTLAVALAASRASALKWQNSNTDIGAMTNYGNGSFYITAGMTDAQLNAVGFNDDATARSNTTNMQVAGSPAANSARSKTIGGVACDLPNIQQMKRIFALKAEIDALDHTLAANPSLGLNAWAFGGGYAWASTEQSYSGAWYVSSNGLNGYGTSNKIRDALGIIPVREM